MTLGIVYVDLFSNILNRHCMYILLTFTILMYSWRYYGEMRILQICIALHKYI